MSYTPNILASGIISAQATLDVNMSAYYNLYSVIEVHWISIIPATTNTDLWLRVSVDGTTFDGAAASYEWVAQYNTSSTFNQNVSASDTKIVLSQNVDNTAGSSTSGVVRIYSPSATIRPLLRGEGVTLGASQALIMQHYGAQRLASQVTKGIRLLFSSGNITSGSYRIIGIK